MNILVLTTIYKDPEDAKDSATTPIVHNFAKEWVKDGNRVIVIHNFNKFLYPMYFIPTCIKNLLSNKLGFRASLNIKQRKIKHYREDGIEVFRLPILKIVPRGGYSGFQLKKQIKKIEKVLEENKFVPDIILGHAENPQIYQIYVLKQKFKNTKTGIVFHGIEYLQRKKFKVWKDVYLPSIDSYGFRSEGLYRLAQEKIGFSSKYFLCPSGINDKYTHCVPSERKKIRRLLFVGQLIQRKHVMAILEALYIIQNNELELEIIGEGAEKEKLKEYVGRKKLKNITFEGKLEHDDVLEHMKAADCFIMISEKEVFGLVYLEAMSQGCITIASIGEGMQGIIENGVNGYLCPAGDAMFLAKLVSEISNLSEENIRNIRNASYETAKEFSESNVAQKYLNAVMENNEEYVKRDCEEKNKN